MRPAYILNDILLEDDPISAIGDSVTFQVCLQLDLRLLQLCADALGQVFLAFVCVKTSAVSRVLEAEAEAASKSVGGIAASKQTTLRRNRKRRKRRKRR